MHCLSNCSSRMKGPITLLLILQLLLLVSEGRNIIKRSTIQQTQSLQTVTNKTQEIQAEGGSGDVPAVSSEWKADVINTLGTLKSVLSKFEKKWKPSGNHTVHQPSNNTKLVEQLNSNVSSIATNVPEQNEFTEEERKPIRADASKRKIGQMVLGCPHAWPHHDVHPQHKATCSADTECGSGELCCQLFNNNYCLEAVDATPRPGSCRFVKFDILATLHCMVDDPGCKHDSECSEPTWKCCQGPCSYKECFPSTLSPKPADIKRRLEEQSPVEEAGQVHSSNNNRASAQLVASPPQQQGSHLPIVKFSEPNVRGAPVPQADLDNANEVAEAPQENPNPNPINHSDDSQVGKLEDDLNIQESKDPVQPKLEKQTSNNKHIQQEVQQRHPEEERQRARAEQTLPTLPSELAQKPSEVPEFRKEAEGKTTAPTLTHNRPENTQERSLHNQTHFGSSEDTPNKDTTRQRHEQSEPHLQQSAELAPTRQPRTQHSQHQLQVNAQRREEPQRESSREFHSSRNPQQHPHNPALQPSQLNRKEQSPPSKQTKEEEHSPINRPNQDRPVIQQPDSRKTPDQSQKSTKSSRGNARLSEPFNAPNTGFTRPSRDRSTNSPDNRHWQNGVFRGSQNPARDPFQVNMNSNRQQQRQGANRRIDSPPILSAHGILDSHSNINKQIDDMNPNFDFFSESNGQQRGEVSDVFEDDFMPFFDFRFGGFDDIYFD